MLWLFKSTRLAGRNVIYLIMYLFNVYSNVSISIYLPKSVRQSVQAAS